MKRILVFLLAGSMLLLSGCGGKEQNGGDRSEIYETASGLSSDQVLLSVDGQKITAGQYLYWLADTCGYIEKYYGGGDVDWNSRHDGKTLAEYAKAQALQTVSLYGVIEAWAGKYGCTLTEDDQEGIDSQWNARVKQYGSEKAYKAVLTGLGIDEKTVRRFSADYYLYGRLYRLFCTKGSSLCPKSEDVDKYAKDSGLLTVDAILISTAGAADGAAKAEKKERADMVLAKLKKSSEPTEYFSTLAGAYSDDGDREKYPGGRTFTPGGGTFPSAVEAAAKNLKENTYSGVIETEGGYYILLRRALDTDAVKAAYFDSLLQKAAERAAVKPSSDYQKIDPAAFYKKLTAAEKSVKSEASSASESASSASG